MEGVARTNKADFEVVLQIGGYCMLDVSDSLSNCIWFITPIDLFLHASFKLIEK